MRIKLTVRRAPRRVMLLAAIAIVSATAPRAVSAEGLFDFLFGGAPKQPSRQAQPSNFFDPFGTQQPAPAVAETESEKAARRRSTVREKVSFGASPPTEPSDQQQPTTSAPAPAEVPSETTTETAPRRAGWWSRRFGGE